MLNDYLKDYNNSKDDDNKINYGKRDYDFIIFKFLSSDEVDEGESVTTINEF